MRELSFNEIAFVSGAENHNVTVIDPVAAAQTLFFIMSVTDRDGFVYGSVITGMLGGAVTGGFMAYTALATYPVAAIVGGAVAGAAAGTVVGGFVLKGAAMFGVSAYNFIMG